MCAEAVRESGVYESSQEGNIRGVSVCVRKGDMNFS